MSKAVTERQKHISGLPKSTYVFARRTFENVYDFVKPVARQLLSYPELAIRCVYPFGAPNHIVIVLVRPNISSSSIASQNNLAPNPNLAPSDKLCEPFSAVLC